MNKELTEIFIRHFDSEVDLRQHTADCRRLCVETKGFDCSFSNAEFAQTTKTEPPKGVE